MESSPRASRLPLVLFACGVLLLLAAVVTGTSSAAAGGGVKIKGGSAVTAQEIKDAQDVDGKNYTVRTQPGSKGKTKKLSGTSIETLVGLAGLQEGDFAYLTFPGPGGTTIYLSSKDIFHPESAFAGSRSALVTIKSGQVRFFRPVRGASKRETSDEYLAAPGEILRVGSEADGNVLGVAITSSDPSPAKGDTIELTAKASGKTLPGEKVRYSWKFSDGGSATGDKVDHEVRSSKDIVATATAVGTRGSGGQASVTLDVGKPDAEPEDEDSASGVGTGGGTGTEANGVGAPAPDPSSTYPYDLGNYGNYGSYGDYGGYDPNLGLPPSDTTPGTSQNQVPPGPEDPTQSTPTLDPSLETISGTLVTNLSGAPGAPTRSDSAPAAESEPATASIAAFSQDDSESSVTLPLTGAGVVLLFIAGAWRELLRSHRRLA